jgi:cysteine synthase A
MKQAYNNILAAIGNTPLVQLQQLFPDANFRIFAKLEGTNPGGSIKDRPAAKIIQNAFEAGVIDSASTVIESSSGNMGIGLAQICAYYKLRFICVVDPKITSQNMAILNALGAEVDLVSKPDPNTGEFLQARINRVKELLQQISHSFWPDQYSNLGNPEAHYGTMREIVTALDGDVDHLFCATSTCGTMRGCATYIRKHKLHVKVWAVDAVGSVLFGSKPAKRLIPGHGASLVPDLYQPGLEDACIHVTDLDCIRGCHQLVAQEAILAGGSSGAIVSALEKVRTHIADDSTCVLVLPDRGERYLDTVYSEAWVKSHFSSSALEHINGRNKASCPMAAY